jgi:hypothetical protein
MNKPRIKKQTFQLSLSINGVTVVKRNVKEDGSYYGVHYDLPKNFSYSDLQQWKEDNAAAIKQFRKQPN